MSKNYLSNLNKYQLLAGLNSHEIEAFYPLIHIETFEENKFIIAEGEIGDFLFLLLEGKVEISQALTLSIKKEGGEDLENDTREKAFTTIDHTIYPFIGEMSLFSEGLKRSASVKTLTTCTVGILKNKDILKLCEKNKVIGYQIMTNVSKKLAQDLRNANQNILKLTTALNFILE